MQIHPPQYFGPLHLNLSLVEDKICIQWKIAPSVNKSSNLINKSVAIFPSLTGPSGIYYAWYFTVK